MRLKLSLLLVLGLVASLPLLADVLTLKDGSEMEGTFLGGDSRTIRFLKNDGQMENLLITEIEGLLFGPEKAAPAQVAAPRPAMSAPAVSAAPSLAPSSANAPRPGPATGMVAAGTVLVVRMIDPVNSDSHKPGDTFRATLDEPITLEGTALAPKGTLATVQLVHVKQSGQLRGEEEIALQLKSIRLNEKTYSVATRFAQVASEGKGGQTAKVVGGTAAVGAIIGAITKGKKGAAVGAAAGAGTGVAVQALRGKKVQVPSETRLAFTLEEALEIG